MKQITKKAIYVLMIMLMCLQYFSGICMAVTEISKANLKNDHAITTNLQYKNADGTWHDISCNYICYTHDGTKYPAYCIKHGVHGVDEEGPYTVNISKLLEDDKIWRTIVNGYPYKTPAQLGVETADDAYLATKQAINSVVLNRNVKTYYNGTNTKGKKVVEAIYNISQAGKNGTQTRKSANLKITKAHGLTKYNDEYDYIEYKVTADVNIDTYTVKSTTGFPSGSYITDTSGNQTTTLAGGKNFRVMVPRSKITMDFTGTVKVAGKCKTYPIFFGEAPKSSVQDYAITYDAYGDFEASGKSTEKVNTAKIKVVKKDEESAKAIEGVSFKLSKQDGTVISTQKTNSKGEIEFSALYPGEYILQETATTEHYILDTTKHSVTLNYDQTVTKNLTNKHKKGNLRIIKVDKDDKDITLGGIEFDLLDEDKGVVAHLTTDADGEAYIENINTGNYTLRETKTKKEYKLCVDEDLVVKWNATAEIIIKNEKKKGQIKVIKEDKDHHEVKLSGVEFEVLDKNNRIVEKLVTDKNGEATTSRLPIGDYKLKEVSLGTNTEYVMDDTMQQVMVEEDKIKNITFENEHQKGSLKIVKVDKDNHSIALANVEFEVTDEMGEKYHIITNKNGEAEIPRVRTGRVIIKETKTGELYSLNKEMYNVEIKYNKESEITVENEKKKGQVQVYKTDAENKKVKLKDVEFQVLDKNHNVVDTLVTDKNGHAISKEIPIGEYYLKETKTNHKYILNDELVNIEIKEKDITTMQFTNQKKKGRISIMKTSSQDSPRLPIKQGQALAGVVFEIYDRDNHLVETIATDAQGKATSGWIEVGKYRVKEVSTLDYFLLDTSDYFVTISNHGETQVLNIENEPEIPGLDVEKRGPEAASKNEEIKYQFDIANTGNVELNDFTWTENIPYEQISATKMITGTYNANLDYKIYYKTDKSDYHLFKEVNTEKNEYLDLTTIHLSKSEHITNIKVEFGKVPVGFKNITAPCIFAKVNSQIKDLSEIINTTELEGSRKGYKLKDKDECITKVKERNVLKKLPRTGC